MPGSISRRLFGVQGVLLIAGGLASGVVGWLILGLLRPIAAHLEADGRTVEPLVERALDQREIILVPAAAAVACGLALVVTSRFRWAWLAAGTLAAAAVIAIALTCFLMLIAPLYQSSAP